MRLELSPGGQKSLTRRPGSERSPAYGEGRGTEEPWTDLESSPFPWVSPSLSLRMKEGSRGPWDQSVHWAVSWSLKGAGQVGRQASSSSSCGLRPLRRLATNGLTL